MAFIRRKFLEYYSENSEKIPMPTSLPNREFGFVIFRERMMVRHKGFINGAEVKAFLKSMTPMDAYYSSAYYERPEEHMENKGWLGADLIFDIDSDHLQTPCKSEHDYWICESCQNSGRGQQPELCRKCGGSKFKNEAWLCETCLEAAKAETQKLLSFLQEDFGFLPQDIEICFSGHRGYHVHVENEDVRQLDQVARKEIVDYVLGTGLKVEFHGLMEVGKSKIVEGPNLFDPSWNGRIAKGVYDFLKTSTPQQIEEIEGIKSNKSKKAMEHRDLILKSWNKKARWGALKDVSFRTWVKLAEYGLKKQTSFIDTVVTTDIHRLIRAPFTLHGKTGLKAVSISLEHLKQFDPFVEAIAFSKGTLKVNVNESHKFRLGNEVFGPYRQETIELPMAAAMYLLCKKAASPVE
ncbi:MAG: primase small subunit [Thermoproteota archaeon]|nr:primase small subunit [Thermoproteota archaeon]